MTIQLRHNIHALQYHRPTIQQHNNTSANKYSFPYIITTKPYDNITNQQYNNITILQSIDITKRTAAVQNRHQQRFFPLHNHNKQYELNFTCHLSTKNQPTHRTVNHS